MPIRYGEFCNKCQTEVNVLEARNKKKGIYNVLQEEAEGGKMRFLDSDKKDKK